MAVHWWRRAVVNLSHVSVMVHHCGAVTHSQALFAGLETDAHDDARNAHTDSDQDKDHNDHSGAVRFTAVRPVLEAVAEIAGRALAGVGAGCTVRQAAGTRLHAVLEVSARAGGADRAAGAARAPSAAAMAGVAGGQVVG